MCTAAMNGVNYEAAKAWLERGWNIERRIRAKEAQLDRMRDRLSSLKLSQPSGMPRGARRGDWTRAVDAVEDQEQEIWQDIEALCATRREIRAAIQEVPSPRHRELLEYRYLCCMPWPKVAENMGYDERNTYRIHRKALEKLTIECQGLNGV